MTTPNQLPPFPVDDATLDLLWAALHPGPGAERSSLSDFLELMAQMGGSDPTAISEVVDDSGDGEAHIVVLRDQFYSHHDVITALIEEVRRLRAVESESWKAITGLASELEEARAERDQLRGHILDIDAHATPYGDIPDERRVALPPSADQIKALMAAVDAYRSATPDTEAAPRVVAADTYVARALRSIAEALPGEDPDLLQLYALLALIRGADTTLADVHDAWAIWRHSTRPDHPAIVPFDELSRETQELDRPYRDAISRVAEPAPGGER